MGAAGSTLHQGVGWVSQGASNLTSAIRGRGPQSQSARRAEELQRRRRRRRRALRRRQLRLQRLHDQQQSPNQPNSGQDQGPAGPGRVRSQRTEDGDVVRTSSGRREGDDYDSLDDDLDSDDSYLDDDDDDLDDDDYDSEGDELDEDEDDDSLLDEEYERRKNEKNGGGYDNHPLYFGPAFHPVTEQSPAQLQLQRQIEQQLEQQQRQEFWQQQYRQQQQQQQQLQQMSQQEQSQGQNRAQVGSVGGVPLNDLILPSAIPGMGGSGGTGVGAGVGGSPPTSPTMSPLSPTHTESVQDQLYRNSNLYNLISGLNVNPLLTEVQRAGTLDLSVLEQELDDVEGGWMDIDDEDEEDDNVDDDDIDYGKDGIVREMQPTRRSPTALACSVNLKKSTLRLVKNFSISNDPSIPAPSHLRPNYRLDFTFDSLTPCDVKLYWVVKEVEEDGELGLRLRRLHHLPQPTTYHFPAGMNQRFISPILPLYTMSLPELTMQGLPSNSMKTFQKRQQQQRMWQMQQQQQQQFILQQMQQDLKDGIPMSAEDMEEGLGYGDDGRKSRFGKKGKKNKKSDMGFVNSVYNQKYPSGMSGANGGMMNLSWKEEDEDGYKAIMEDQYYPLVILIEATKEYNPNAPVRSLPAQAPDAPGLYLVENQAISTFACFNISSEGGFEIKVMKQKVWVNSTNYLIQEIYGFTDSVSSPAASKKPPSNKKSTKGPSSTHAPALQQQGKQPISRSMSRLSRAESIASRVTELTMNRGSKRQKNKRKSKDSDAHVSGSSAMLESKRMSRASMVAGLDIAEQDESVVPEDGKRMSDSSVTTVGTSISASEINGHSKDQDPAENQPGGGGETEEGATRVNEEERSATDKDEEEEEEEEEEDEDEEDEANLVLLDAPECVICLSDVKDTIVLPCRHFCICSECGDVLRRRAPQRCPICRQVFQALLHISSTPTRKREFTMVPAPTSVTVPEPVAVGGSRQGRA